MNPRTSITAIALLGAALLFQGCSTIKLGNASVLDDGIYRTAEKHRVYVDEEDEREITVYSYDGERSGDMIAVLHPTDTSSARPAALRLRKNSFDLDLVSAPIKLRRPTAGVPAQLNANFSAALFVGFRKDLHTIHYRPTPPGPWQRKVSNIGFSFGALTGFANTLVNETTTAGFTTMEYDGIVWMYGIGAIVGVEQITLGVAAGYDVLLDGNRAHWVYNERPWLGLTIGLNLN